MREHDESTPDHSAVSLLQRTVQPDHDGAAPSVAKSAPHSAPRRRRRTFALLAAVACTVCGAKLFVISALGSPMPLLDQWDAEAAGLYSPYLRGALSLADLFAPHNEHRILVFRLFALVHLELAGEWNTRLEMIFGAIVHTAAITWLAALLLPLVAVRRRVLLAGFTAFVFAFPVVYENALWAFQDQVYLALFFGIAALVVLAFARPFSVRWFCGLAAAILSYFSFATGVAAVLAAVLLVGLQLATNARKRCGREFGGFLVLVAFAVAMVAWTASCARPTSTPWTFVQGLLVLFALAGLGFVPTVAFCYHTVARRPGVSDHAWVVVGICAWLAIQLVLFAYGRGAAVGVRYLDIVLLVYPVGLTAMFALGDQPRAARFGRFGPRAAVGWMFTVVAALALLGYYGSVLGAVDWSKAAQQQMVNAQAYLATGNADVLRSRGRGGHGIELAHPNPQRVAQVLGDPYVKAVLPSELRPADADNAAARNRTWLKGSLADSTAAAVRLVLGIGPILVALGAGLLFATGARRTTPGAQVLWAAAGGFETLHRHVTPVRTAILGARVWTARFAENAHARMGQLVRSNRWHPYSNVLPLRSSARGPGPRQGAGGGIWHGESTR
ncbi:hypothetical protein [Mycobacterium paraense]|uniref:hypothetical protein n=1 Tax=Mycobacterium paraense TaxID=767916 RepID=UPI001150E551|nr:hypothetical protein [Mycobacterium paraense]